MKILIVDDDQLNAKLLSKRLEKRGYDADTVHCGMDCLSYLEKETPELVLLDIMMPDLTGTEVLRRIRETTSKVELPVVMVTAKNETVDIIEALKLGANDYIAKPINIEIAVARIESQKSLKELHCESLKNKELETANSMIVTYNHEINNPLTIALGMLARARSTGDEQYLEKVDQSLKRIADIVKKIDNLSENSIETDSYSSDSKMMKLK